MEGRFLVERSAWSLRYTSLPHPSALRKPHGASRHLRYRAPGPKTNYKLRGFKIKSAWTAIEAAGAALAAGAAAFAAGAAAEEARKGAAPCSTPQESFSG